MQASPNEIRFLHSQRLLEPTTSKASWVLLSVVNQALECDLYIAPEIRHALKSVELGGVSGLEMMENAEIIIQGGTLVSDRHNHRSLFSISGW